MQYGGYRFNTREELLLYNLAIHPNSSYKHWIGFGDGRIDIPKGFEGVAQYNGTLGHKTNHSFDANVIIGHV